MPSLCAASSTVLPGGTCTALPSISRFSIATGRAGPPGRPKGAPAPWGETSEASYGGVSSIRIHEAALVVDVVLEFVAEVLDEALHRQRSGIAQRADSSSSDVIGD